MRDHHHSPSGDSSSHATASGTASPAPGKAPRAQRRRGRRGHRAGARGSARGPAAPHGVDTAAAGGEGGHTAAHPTGPGAPRQRDRAAGTLPDHSENPTFTHTHTYAAFLAEVRRWLAARVQSRTHAAHRERQLLADNALRGPYGSIRPGQPITMLVFFHSNGYSFRRITLSWEDSEIDVNLAGESPAESRGGGAPSAAGQQGSGARAMPEEATPGAMAAEEARDAVIDAAKDQAEDSLRDHLIEQLDAEALGTLFEVLGAILQLAVLANQIYQDADPTIYSMARGFGTAVQAHRIAEYVFTHGTSRVMGAAHAYVHLNEAGSSDRTRHFGGVLNEALEETGRQWSRARHAIDASRNRHHGSEGNTRSFRTQAELASHLVQHSVNPADVAFYRDRYHHAYAASGSFHLHLEGGVFVDRPVDDGRHSGH